MIRTYSSEEHIKQLDVAVLFENLTVEYLGRPVLLNINMEIPSGCLMAVMGPNNAGKTTFLKVIAGLEKATSGSVYVFSKKSDPLVNDIAYVPSRKSINWDYPVNVYDFVHMGTYNKIKNKEETKQKCKEIVMDAVKRVGLEKVVKNGICDLTRGEKHRALIARALAQNSRIFIMDEPMVAADEESVAIIVDILQELKKKQKTVIVAHHDFVTIPKYFDMVTLLNTKLIATGSTETILNIDNFETAYGAAGVIKNIKLHMEKNS